MRNRLLALLLLGGSFTALPGPAGAENRAMRKDLGGLAKKIKDGMVQEGIQSITINNFNPQGSLGDASTGPGIKKILEEELKALEVEVKPKQDFILDGTFRLVEDEKSEGHWYVAVEAVLRRANGKPLGEFPVEVRVKDLDAIKTIANVTVATPSTDEEGDGKKNVGKVVEKVRNPTVFIHPAEVPSKVSSAKGSPYAVEVAVKDHGDYKPRAAKEEDGRAYVSLEAEDIYRINVYNDGEAEVGVSITIDGLDVFAFSEERNKDGRPRVNYYVLAKKSGATVSGWYLHKEGKDNYAQFCVTKYGDGAVSRLAPEARGKRGAITVNFHPTAAAATLGKDKADTGKLETRRGAKETVKVEEVKRAMKPSVDTISVYYDRPKP